MPAILRDSVVVVVRTLPWAIPLAMITTRKWIHEFPFIFHDAYGAPLKRKLQNLSAKIGAQIEPIVNNQCVVYKFQCDLYDTDYVGYTTHHLHQRIGEHKHSAIGRHLEDHGLSKSDLKDKQFSILKKCRTKFDCLIFEMLFIKQLKPGLNTQKDSVLAKLFTWHCVQIFLAFNSVLFKSLRICFVHLYITFLYSFGLENDVE